MSQSQKETTQTDSVALQKILHKLGYPDLLEKLCENISGSELNTLLLTLMAQRAAQSSPPMLLQQYQHSRFAMPSQLPLVAFSEFELSLQKIIHAFGFQDIILSPVAPLGSCSVVGTVHQNKILSAIRGMEVMADITNAMALEICRRKQTREWVPATDKDTLRLFTTHRHLRTPPIQNAKFSPHFAILGCVVSGRDQGDCQFETSVILEQLKLYKALLADHLHLSIKVKLYLREGYSALSLLQERIAKVLEELNTSVPVEWLKPDTENAYYQGIQFKIMVVTNDQTWEVADGGFVDWSQKLLQNKKERMLISGLGTELLYKILFSTE
ncbi:hypothetical protein QNI16_20660 [Cytophagaceae bacterium YF14B1]|uniref:Uncharacterized protein n=1 Tax=Xanthocytophaga flava TaxID=3048013 RepID=A0AAE3U7Z2_9BACT|nr:hypothetical protein [Xanthocytophaga flavus]MDJ1482926.1 hypothetical protein [Xanthocytophaga flavus]